MLISISNILAIHLARNVEYKSLFYYKVICTYSVICYQILLVLQLMTATFVYLFFFLISK